MQAFEYGSTNARVVIWDYQTSQLTIYAGSGGAVLSEYTEFAANVPTWTKSFTYLGDSALSTITPNGQGGEYTEYNHPDRLGTRVITNQQSGTSYEQAALPFGTALNAESTISTNKKRFTSYDRSERTGLDYAVNRTYDSKQGRFTQVDPIGMSAESLTAPQTLNLYTYCGNDPINHVDPSGLFFGKLFKAIGNFFKKAWKWIAIAVVVALIVVAVVASQGATAPGFFHALGSFFSKLGIASFITGEAYGFSLGATGIGLIAVAGVGAITNSFQKHKSQTRGGDCGGPGEPPCEDGVLLRIETRVKGIVDTVVAAIGVGIGTAANAFQNSGFLKCFRRYHFSKGLFGGTILEPVAEFVEVGSEVLLLSDGIATAQKWGYLGASKRTAGNYQGASSINWGIRRLTKIWNPKIGKNTLRFVAQKYVSKINPVLLGIGVFTAAYNTGVAIDCATGLAK